MLVYPLVPKFINKNASYFPIEPKETARPTGGSPPKAHASSLKDFI
jgi:hypothetical protein